MLGTHPSSDFIKVVKMEKVGQAFSLPILSELRLSMKGEECQKALEHDGVPSEVLKAVFRT